MDIDRAQRMLRDAQRGRGKYSLDDYIWLVEELSILLHCRLTAISPNKFALMQAKAYNEEYDRIKAKANEKRKTGVTPWQ